jgi:hypothetical protein
VGGGTSYQGCRQKETSVQKHVVKRLPGRTSRCQDRTDMRFEFKCKPLPPVSLPYLFFLNTSAFLLQLRDKKENVKMSSEKKKMIPQKGTGDNL